jgi:para-aminobenzoate synthetase/4-amino-4-deoxychorismate lyase
LPHFRRGREICDVTRPSSPYAIVDFESGHDRARGRLAFTDPLRLWRAETIDRVAAVIDEADRAARAGGWVVGFLAFEAASAFDAAFDAPASPSLPFAWFAEFSPPREEPDDEHVRCSAAPVGEPIGLDPTTTLGDAAYAEAVRRIHEYIDAGDVYQVNLTVPFTASRRASVGALYERMRRAQRGAYSCLLDIGDAQILSASPELFFERRGDRIRSRPMKGTAPRGLHPAADAATRDRLVRSEKDRAENVMIVDVVRNDLGRIAEIGSVRTDALCHAERYPSVWQLTSTVDARVAPGLPLLDVFGALFPPASVTGAPKIRAVSIIRELEGTPRDVYCGALGVIRPGGDATFNVAIRTAWTATDSDVLHLNAGGGVTADSTPLGELHEVRAKLAAFTRPIELPGLFETIRVECGVPLRLHRHLARLAASADYFDVPFDRVAAERALEHAIAHGERADLLRARLELHPDGGVRAATRRHEEMRTLEPARVTFASSPVDRRDVRLYHKCVDRARYDAVRDGAPDMFDVVLWNAEGEVTELTRANLVVELDGRRFTPSLDCGLLAGILRAELLELGEIEERVLTLDDVRRASHLWFVNALRGWVPITLVQAPLAGP